MNYKSDLTDSENVIDYKLEENQKKIHTALPCRVLNFYPNNQTVDLEVLVKKIKSDDTLENYPPLLNVPISYPRGGGFCVTYPLNKGDEGQVIFNERCIDKWWLSGEPSEPIDFRLHDLSDGCFISGICSQPKAVKGFFTDGLSLQTLSGDTFIRIVNGKILIQGDIEHSGNTNQQGNYSQVGNYETQGTISSSGDIKGGSISLQGHVHGGVGRGSSNTDRAK